MSMPYHLSPADQESIDQQSLNEAERDHHRAVDDLDGLRELSAHERPVYLAGLGRDRLQLVAVEAAEQLHALLRTLVYGSPPASFTAWAQRAAEDAYELWYIAATLSDAMSGGAP